MSKQHPSKIRFADNVYELVRTEAPTAGGSYIRTMHRAEDDDAEESDSFADAGNYHVPSLDAIDSSMQALTEELAALRAAHDKQSYAAWEKALDHFANKLFHVKRAVNKENTLSGGNGYRFL